MRALAFILLLAVSSTSFAYEDYVRKPGTTATYTLDGGPILAPNIGQGTTTFHREGQGPQIGLRFGAKYVFDADAIVQRIVVEAATAQSTQSQTNNGVSTYLAIDFSNESGPQRVYYAKPYESNFAGGDHSGSHTWQLDLRDLPEFAGPTKEIDITDRLAGLLKLPAWEPLGER